MAIDDEIYPEATPARHKRRRAVLVGVMAVITAAVVLLRLMAPSEPSAEDLARATATRFLDRYMEADGRVVRLDKGGDTVSEGQAYAMLLAVAIGDQRRFDRAWSWTRAHLQRPDGLLSWHWRRGRVIDVNSATDADVDSAYALVLAAQRFRQPSYLEEGRRIARSILAEETVELPGSTPLLVAGPWARTAPYVINPSHFAPSAFVILGNATGDQRWMTLVRSGHRLVKRLVGRSSALVPDWAQVDVAGTPQPIASPGGVEGQPRYGLDASRLLIRLATDCDESSRRLTIIAGRRLPRQPGRVAAEYDLLGQPLADHGHALADVAASAVALALGDGRTARLLLEHAESLERKTSTYYGAAWLALGRVLLTTTLLTDCSANQVETRLQFSAS
jgi:endoglucanase